MTFGIKIVNIYLFILTTTGVLLLPQPYSFFSLILLLFWVLNFSFPYKTRSNLFYSSLLFFTLPIIMNSFFSWYISPLATLPVLGLVSDSLKKNNLKSLILTRLPGKKLTSISKYLIFLTFMLLSTSIILNNKTLILTTLIFTFFSLLLIVKTYFSFSNTPFEAPLQSKQTVAGMSIDVPLSLTSNTPFKLNGKIKPVDAWMAISPQNFTVNSKMIELTLHFSPSLSGPSKPKLHISATDPWGLIQVDQVISPIDFIVIPRAKYAEWLAINYLTQEGVEVGVATNGLVEGIGVAGIGGGSGDFAQNAKFILKPGFGTDYFESRLYYPGDKIKHLDWKQTIKTNQLIIKDFIGSGENRSILAANLTATSAEEADKLVFYLITTALTLAQENIDTALVVYNHQENFLTSNLLPPKEMLLQTIALIKDISVIKPEHRFLKLSHPVKLKNNINQLKMVNSKPAERLAEILNFEYQALEQASKNHPATLALLKVIDKIPPPAIVLLVSYLNHDAEVFMVLSEKLINKGYSIIPINMV